MAKGSPQNNLTTKNLEIERLKQLGIYTKDLENLDIEQLRSMIANAESGKMTMTRSPEENEELVKQLDANAKKSPSLVTTKIFCNVRDYTKTAPETDPSILDELATIYKLPTVVDYTNVECVKALNEYNKRAEKVYWARVTSNYSMERSLKAVELLWSNDANPSEHGVIILDPEAYKPSLSKNPKVTGQRALPYQAKLLLQIATRTFVEPRTLEKDSKINLGSLSSGTTTVTTSHEIYGNNSYKYNIEIFDELTEDDLLQYHLTAKGHKVVKDNIINPTPTGYVDENGFHPTPSK